MKKNHIHDLEREVAELKAEVARLTGAAATDRDLRAGLYLALECAPVVVWAVDSNGVFILSEGGGLRALSLRPGEVVGQSVYSLYAGTDIGEHVARALRGETFSERVRVNNLTYETVYSPILNERNTVRGVTGVSTDVTERVLAESSLMTSEKRFRSLVETTSDWVWELDEQLNFVYASPRVGALLGLSVDDVLGRSRFDLVCEADRETVRREIAGAIANAAPFQGLRFTSVHRDGRSVVIESSGAPVFDEKKALVGYRGIDRDVTSQVDAQHAARVLQAQLFHAQKMETIGTLAGGIAHDFNNILSPILGYTEMAIEALDAGHPAREDLLHVLRATRRARDLVHQILVFSSRADHDRVRLQPHLIVREAVELLRSSIPSSIEISQHIDASAGWVVADAGQLHQVVMNLCTNAAQAIGSAPGRIRIEVRQARVSDPRPQNTELEDGNYVQLAVVDTGAGMDSETRRRIFEPFFSTREIGKGTGLGLSVVHGIVQSHGGVVQVESAPGRGSTFSVYLPAVAPGETPAPESEPATSRGHEHILLVDDEADIARLGKRLLEPLGYRVSSWDDPRAALRAFRRAPGEYDLVITDLTMPRITGLELAAAVRELDASIPIIVTTGYSDVVSPEQARRHGVTDFIMKPFAGHVLMQKIRKSLDAGGPTSPGKD